MIRQRACIESPCRTADRFATTNFALLTIFDCLFSSVDNSRTRIGYSIYTANNHFQFLVYCSQWPQLRRDYLTKAAPPWVCSRLVVKITGGSSVPLGLNSGKTSFIANGNAGFVVFAIDIKNTIRKQLWFWDNTPSCSQSPPSANNLHSVDLALPTQLSCLASH